MAGTGTKRLERVALRPREAERNGKPRPSVSAAATKRGGNSFGVVQWKSETAAVSRRPLSLPACASGEGKCSPPGPSFLHTTVHCLGHFDWLKPPVVKHASVNSTLRDWKGTGAKSLL